MKAFAKFKAFFGRLTQEQPEPPWPGTLDASLPTDDTTDETQTIRDDDPLGYAEGQSFIIEYCDSRGALSVRRITVWGIKRGADGVPLLVAKCHERKATRTFRIDRIRAITDYDGVVQEPLSKFLEDTFGLRMDAIVQPAPPEKPAKETRKIEAQLNSAPDLDPADQWKRIRAACRDHGVHLLASIARSDGELHPKEVESLFNYAVEVSTASGISPNDFQATQLRDYVRRLRPTREVIDRTLDHVLELPEQKIARLLTYGAYVIQADGVTQPEELSALRELEASLNSN